MKLLQITLLLSGSCLKRIYMVDWLDGFLIKHRKCNPHVVPLSSAQSEDLEEIYSLHSDNLFLEELISNAFQSPQHVSLRDRLQSKLKHLSDIKIHYCYVHKRDKNKNHRSYAFHPSSLLI